ncbi:MAG: ferritin family protein [Anaerolineae bacterium]
MKLIDVLAEALKLERDGEKFYNTMVHRVEDEDGKAMFKQLAEDEVDHYNYISRQYEALQEGKGWSAIPEMELVESIDAVSLVFPPDEKVMEELPENPDEQDALLFGLSIEDKSFKLYHGSAERADDPEAKKLFLQLAGAEQRHFEILMQRYESRYPYPR